MSPVRKLALSLAATAAVFAAACRKEQKAPPAQAVTVAAEATYYQQCAICHGRSGKGDTMVAANNPLANLADTQWGHGSTREDIIKNIAEGIPQTPMCGFKGALTDQEIGEVTDYVLALSKR